MLKEAFGKDCESCNDSVDFKAMIMLAIATSIIEMSKHPNLLT